MGKAHQVFKAYQGIDAMITARRAIVAECLVKGMTYHEIRDELTAREHINPKSEKPWAICTVSGDVKNIRTMWEQEVRLHYDVHVSRILGQIRAVRKSAWEQMKLETILKTLEQEVKLLGLDKATAADLDWKEEMRKVGLDPAREFEGLVQSAYSRMMAAKEEQMVSPVPPIMR